MSYLRSKIRILSTLGPSKTKTESVLLQRTSLLRVVPDRNLEKTGVCPTYYSEQRKSGDVETVDLAKTRISSLRYLHTFSSNFLVSDRSPLRILLLRKARVGTPLHFVSGYRVRVPLAGRRGCPRSTGRVGSSFDVLGDARFPRRTGARPRSCLLRSRDPDSVALRSGTLYLSQSRRTSGAGTARARLPRPPWGRRMTPPLASCPGS